MAIGEAPVLEAVVDINAVSLARTELDPVTLLMAVCGHCRQRAEFVAQPQKIVRNPRKDFARSSVLR